MKRVKRQLRGADGGKHPHVKNIQDFPQPNHSPDERFLASLREHLVNFRIVITIEDCQRYRQIQDSFALHQLYTALVRLEQELTE